MGDVEQRIIVCPHCGIKFCPFCGLALASPDEDMSGLLIDPGILRQHGHGIANSLREFAHEVRQEVPAITQRQVIPQRRQPAATASVESDVKVPLLQAIACGCGLGLVSFCISVPVAFTYEWTWWIAPTLILGVTIVGAVGAWFLLLLEQRKLLWLVEDIVGADLDGDGQQGEPTPREPETWRFEITDSRTELEDGEERRANIQYMDNPVSPDTMSRIATVCFERGCSFTRGALVASGVISDGDCRKLHEVWRKYGLARYIEGKPNLGTELTARGKALLRQFLPPSPTMFRELEI